MPDPSNASNSNLTNKNPPNHARIGSTPLDVAISILDAFADITLNTPYINILGACLKQLINLKKAFDASTDRAAQLINTIGEVSEVLARGLEQVEDAELARGIVLQALAEDLGRYQAVLDDARLILEKWSSRTLPGRILKLSSFKVLAEGIEHRLNLFRDTFSMARLVSLSTGQDILISQVKLIASDITNNKLTSWLKPPNAGVSNQEAAKNRAAGTGRWLLHERVEFTSWKYAPNSLLWLYGISGCGKTVLSSSIIAHLRDSGVPLAFFYFDTNNLEERTLIQFLSSLVVQLSVQVPKPHGTLEEHWSAHASGQHLPDVTKLIQICSRLVSEFTEDVYILIDALDESSERDEVLRVIHNDLLGTGVRHLHVLLTSRPEVIRIMPELMERSVPIDMDGCVDQDIASFVDHVLVTDVRLSKWTDVWKAKAKSRLLEQGSGMFRLVSLQLDQLRRCTHPLRREQTLSAMPTSLYDIYDRILDNIDDPYMLPDVHRVLNWLVYSSSPLNMSQLVDTIAFDFECTPLRFDAEARMDETALIEACAGLISVVSTDGKMIVKLAHSSVKEYVLAPDRRCKITERSAHYLLASTCVAYLSSFDRVLSSYDELAALPLAEYATRQWFVHLQKCDPDDSALLTDAVIHLLEPDSMQYTSLYRLGLPGQSNETADWSREADTCYDPLYVCAFIGHAGAVKVLIDGGADVNAPPRDQYYGTPLQAAALGGFEAVVLQLLDSGADVNATSGHHHTALQAASFGGFIGVVGLLLDHGADANVTGGSIWCSLHAAAGGGHVGVVRLLLERGADSHARGGKLWTALHAAAASGSVELVRLFIERGLDVNEEGGSECLPLHAAAIHSHTEVVRLLLASGADVNKMCDKHPEMRDIQHNILRMFLRNGFRFTQQGGAYGTALQAACSGGSVEVVSLLLAQHADVNALGGIYGTALQAAAIEGSIEVVQILLDSGALVNPVGGYYGTALHAASYRSADVVRLLLDRGAPVNAEAGDLHTALQTACSVGTIEIVSLLLEHGADVNLVGGYLGSALQAAVTAASESEALAMVRLLLERGAVVNLPRAGKYGSALNAAEKKDYGEIAELLLARGAERHEDDENPIPESCVIA
ncbi:ankyrin repeat-containing domain protein [Roridomyces roridus]|uniref:Ankyrin repeat-containing domain protein n=1 Tax=Roridomyces roridus TaxID=1738132 RepID=A0AAD7FG11_9AGAR|nr:ankyrin repeat-containing domain protein [Roridomyces roridus]